MPQERLFRAGSPAAGGSPDDQPAWRLAADRAIRIGTASWTDKTLIDSGRFYPSEVRSPADRLRFYTESFPIVEVDATYYALPTERNARLWAERTPSGFVFNVKAFALMTTHPTPPRSFPPDLREALGDLASKRNVYVNDVPREITDEVWGRFCSSLVPLLEAGRLGAVLLQFPEWFVPSRANRDYILECRDRLASALPDAWAAVEFRNEGWMRDADRQERTLRFLHDNGLPYVCVDMPQGFRSSIPPLPAVTAELAMVRFHGRRRKTWDERGITASERFRYNYKRAELEEWLPRMDALADAREVHVLMNNCYSDYAVRSAKTMASLLLDDRSAG